MGLASSLRLPLLSPSPHLLSPPGHYNGAVFFMLTVMTTIGYGTFAPSTPVGLMMVVVMGTTAIVVFGLCLAPTASWVDEQIVMRGAKWLLAKLRRPADDTPAGKRREMLSRLVVTTLAFHACLGLVAAVMYLFYFDLASSW